MKIIALDIGDVHTGVAYADDLGMIATPYQTINSKTLINWLTRLFEQEPIQTVIVGYPKTLKGTHSIQTEKVLTLTKALKQTFPSIQWTLLDERLTSKQAKFYLRNKVTKQRHSDHAIAAAILLQTHLNALTDS